MRTGLHWLDFKLGIRMLVRYPMLTLVGGLAMAVAIGVGAATFEMLNRITNPTLPLPEGDRIVGLDYWNRAASDQRRATPSEFLAWRDGLRTIEDLGAFRLVQRNLIVGDDYGEPIEAAEISAAAFRLTRVPPLLGRTLVEADEDARAPAVAVIGYRLWQTRFGADASVVGRVVRLGETPATIVGVMPDGFLFPMAHKLWIPLRAAALPHEPDRPVALRTFGRLAPGVALPAAQAELTTFASRIAAEDLEQYTNLQPRVLPYAQSMLGIPPDLFVRAGIQSVNGFAALFLIVVCGNVALLMFARAATREREILVRRALGAIRHRIVVQLFTEALVLGAIAAVIGLTAANVGLTWGLAALNTEQESWPFWFDGGLSSTTLIYAALLTLVAAAMAGVIPALKITKTGLEAGLRQASAGGGGLRMGGIWTAVIIAQIAMTVVFTAVAYITQRQAAGIASARAAFPADEYLAVRIEMDESVRPRYATTIRELEQRIAADSRIAGVTLAERLPMMGQDGNLIELDDAGPEEASRRRHRFVARTAVDRDFFDVLRAPVLAGRGVASLDASVNTVVVNQLFVQEILGGRNAIGRRIRYTNEKGRPATEPGPWFEIVGVVRDLVPAPPAPLNVDNPARPLVYHALDATTYPLYLGLHVKGEPKAMVPTLRRMAAEISPALRLTDIQRLDEAKRSDARAWAAFASAVFLVSALALVLSLAGIYAVMSFAASRRTREIAVRVALGAPATSVLANVFRRPVGQVAAGVATGCLLVGSLIAFSLRDSDVTVGTALGHVVVLLAYGAAMMVVCGAACVGPVRRVLRVDPIDALRDDG